LSVRSSAAAAAVIPSAAAVLGTSDTEASGDSLLSAYCVNADDRSVISPSLSPPLPASPHRGAELSPSSPDPPTHHALHPLPPLEGTLPHAAWNELQAFLPRSSSFSSAATTVVSLIADRVALPELLNIIPLTGVLPPSVAATYSRADPTLLRPATEQLALSLTHPLTRRRPSVSGDRAQYVRLI